MNITQKRSKRKPVLRRRGIYSLNTSFFTMECELSMTEPIYLSMRESPVMTCRWSAHAVGGLPPYARITPIIVCVLSARQGDRVGVAAALDGLLDSRALE